MNLLTKIALTIPKTIYNWTLRTIEKEFYFIVLGLYVGLLAVLSLLYQKNSNFFTFCLFVSILMLLVPICIKVFKKILSNKKNEVKFFYQLSGFWLATFFLITFSSIHLISYKSGYSNLIILPIFISLYYYSRYFVVKWINNWAKYLLLFALMPLFASIIYIFIGIFLTELTGYKLFASNSMLLWMAVLLSILLINIIVLWTPLKRFDEVRVAIYVLLAISSSISYCFFISDLLATYLTPKINSLSGQLLEKETVEEFVDNFVKWGTLPYLIGSVWACAGIELKTRNYNRRNRRENVNSD